MQEQDDENMSLEEEEGEEGNKNLGLGRPMQPHEDDEDDEQLENEERKLPPSPPMDEGNLQYIADDKLCFYDSDDDDEYQPMPNEHIIDNNFKDDDEYGLDMFYDSKTQTQNSF